MSWVDNLTPRESETLQAIIDTGCHKSAARRIGIAIKTVDCHACGALAAYRDHTGDKFAPRLRMLIDFDRAQRAPGGAA